jgi:hypothetical protein
VPVNNERITMTGPTSTFSEINFVVKNACNLENYSAKKHISVLFIKAGEAAAVDIIQGTHETLH